MPPAAGRLFRKRKLDIANRDARCDMSVVILGGNECMERQYSNTCREYGCRAKIFLKPCADMKNRIGSPDLLIIFTHTISHKMLRCALAGVCGETKVVRSHTSSMNSLIDILKENAQPCRNRY
jgi:hypothetical protein